MSIFSSPSFDHHELVAATEDRKTGLRAIVAIHDTTLGMAMGGCRMYPYANDADALEDVLRLSRGMTYKSALAGLPIGGGKSVIIGDPRRQKTEPLLEAMGKFLDTLNGRYITGEDSGTCVADMHVIRRQTAFVAGLDEGPAFNGDPAPFTALGTVYGIQAALRHQRGSDSLQGISIAVQGAGAVGRNLIRTMVSQGAKVFAADTNPQNMAMAEHLGAIPVSSKEILELAVDVLAPCAMGAILNQQSIPRINAAIIAGAANNQLAELQHGEFLRERGILHAPDFAINAGGIIRMHHQGHGTTEQSAAHIARIGDTLTSIFRQSDEQNVSTTRVAEQRAEKVLATGHLCHG